MTSEDDKKGRNIGCIARKRKYEYQEITAVKRVRVFVGKAVWDDRISAYRKAMWGDPLPLPTLFESMMVPDFDETGYVGGHKLRMRSIDQNGKQEYVDENFVLFLSHFFSREAAKHICYLAFGNDWDLVYDKDHPRPIWG